MKKPILPSNAAWKDAAGRPLPNEFWRWLREFSGYVYSQPAPAPAEPTEPVEPDLSDYTLLGMGSVFSIGSLADKSVILQLVNDQDGAPPSYYYGTDDAGAKGWHAISDALDAAAGELTKSVDSDTGITTFGLADVPDAGTGTFKLLTRDAKGRLSGTADGTTSDVPEGTNLYHTAERAQDAVGAAIAAGTGDGVTLTYDDAGNKINAANTDKGSVAVASHDAAVDPHPQYALASSIVGPVPTRIAAGQTYTVPADTQALWTLPIELEAGASIEALGDLVEVN